MLLLDRTIDERAISRLPAENSKSQLSAVGMLISLLVIREGASTLMEEECDLESGDRDLMSGNRWHVLSRNSRDFGGEGGHMTQLAYLRATSANEAHWIDSRLVEITW